jgi:hypothetical protein
MSQKIIVEGEPDAIKKHVAARLVNRGLAKWKVRGQSIVRLTERQRPIRTTFKPRTPVFVPVYLPASELPGIKFEPPRDNVEQFPHTVFPDLPQVEC